MQVFNHKFAYQAETTFQRQIMDEILFDRREAECAEKAN